MWIILALLAVLLTVFFVWQNNDIILTYIDYESGKIPAAFDGFRILHVSDLHNKTLGRDQSVLLQMTEEAQPDIIVITGDLIDGRWTDIDAAMAYVSQAVNIAPVYFVSGNQENLSGECDTLCKRLEDAGATVMDNNCVTLKRRSDAIELMGAKDPTFDGDDAFAEELKTLAGGASGFTVLLSHHPEYIDLYAENGFDLVFAGHAHGGQIRLPFIGALFAPGQGFFPKYTSGLYNVGDTSMVVSRGLGNSLFPVRVFNRPELVLVTLQRS